MVAVLKMTVLLKTLFGRTCKTIRDKGKIFTGSVGPQGIAKPEVVDVF
jgi:hypothetical protein